MERLDLEDIQGIVAYSYLNRRHACYLMLSIAAGRLADARERLNELQHYVRSAKPSSQEAKRYGPVVAIAFTHAGLEKLGLPAQTMAELVPEFRESMAGKHRSRVLGDSGDNAPEHWRWGSHARSVDVMLAIYSERKPELEAWLAAYEQAAQGAFTQQACVFAEFKPHNGNRRDVREPFGFRDGISQPFVEGFERAAPRCDAPANVVRAGEFVLGYPNQLGRLSLSPTVAAAEDPDNVLPALPGGRRDLGRNGTYLVARELEQHVDRFEKLPLAVRAKLIGRWPSGAPLTLTPQSDHPALGSRNDFGYTANDRAGLRCPIGAHIRRANPRDGFADPLLPQTPEQSFATVNTHRLLRRGRPFADGPGGARKGTFFICLNTNIERQFEFVQQSWISNPSFMRLNGDRDFAAGADATTFTIPHCAGRQKIEIDGPLVSVRGGGYFFLPGLRALSWLLTPRP